MTEALLLVGDSLRDQNLFYKTHFLAGDPFIYMEHGDRRVLVTSSMEKGRAEKESTADEVRTFEEFGYRDVLNETGDQYAAHGAALVRLLREVGAGDVVVTPAFQAVYADRLRAEGIRVRVDPTAVVSQRRRKTDEEIAFIEGAQRATERAMARAVDMIASSDEHHGILLVGGIPLTSERLRTEIELSFMRDGVESPEGMIVAGGPGAADPHWEGSGPLRAGEAIVLDLFPRSKRSRYFADMTRTVVKGDPGDQLRSMHAAVERAQQAAFMRIRPGASGREVHEAVRDALREAGFDRETGPRYPHGTGHGLGLEVHEQPSLGMHGQELTEGDVVTVEPGLYDPAVGGVRIEDVVVVTAGGSRNLTTFSRQFEL